MDVDEWLKEHASKRGKANMVKFIMERENKQSAPQRAGSTATVPGAVVDQETAPTLCVWSCTLLDWARGLDAEGANRTRRSEHLWRLVWQVPATRSSHDQVCAWRCAAKNSF